MSNPTLDYGGGGGHGGCGENDCQWILALGDGVNVMARFFVPAELWESGEFPAAEGRHASQVLRLGPGDRVEVFDGSGRAAQVELTEVAKRGVRMKVLPAMPG